MVYLHFISACNVNVSAIALVSLALITVLLQPAADFGTIRCERIEHIVDEHFAKLCTEKI